MPCEEGDADYALVDDALPPGQLHRIRSTKSPNRYGPPGLWGEGILGGCVCVCVCVCDYVFCFVGVGCLCGVCLCVCVCV